ncbi:MAG: cation-translocating P-type ATPase [Candidatus Korarchaeota archaeon]|nr:cation-translocating P-type ATPase [Thermoproteota archaeon]
MEKNWHALDVKQVAEELKVDIEYGLSIDEAKERLKIYGYNELPVKKRKAIWEMLLEQIKDIFVLMLIAACLIALFIEKSVVDSVVILAIVAINVAVSVHQEYKAENILEKLRQYAAPKARVMRNGKIFEVFARELVPGDIILLEEGDVVPADARLIEVSELRTNEAPLTGESFPVTKTSGVLPPETPIPDRTNIVYMGTAVVRGHGKAIVIGTGLNTEFGRIARLVEAAEEEVTPLKIKLSNFARKIALIVVALAIGLMTLLVFEKGLVAIVESAMIAISLAVAAVPEGLPAILTITLAIAAKKLAKNNALVKYLLAAETLGSVTVICSDKTGTITTGDMTVKKIYVYDKMYDVSGVGYNLDGKILFEEREVNLEENKLLSKLLMAGVLCTNVAHEREFIGDPTELAIVVAGAKAGILKSGLEAHYRRIREIPFSSERKRMTTVNIVDGKPYALSKGAPEIILDRCVGIETENGILSLSDEIKQKILSIVNNLASDGYRVLAVAYRDLSDFGMEIDKLSEDEIESKLIFIGLFGMIDPPRPEVFEATKKAKKAGINVIMITGDHALTAEAISKQIGLYKPGELILQGKDIDKLSDEDLQSIADKLRVLARAMPEHKLRMVRALKRKSQIVAVTGDGVNDAPALKEAHIGVAMGIKGTEVSKEAADMILLDDNFATIVRAIELGRGVYDKIKAFARFLLSCNIGEVLIITLGVLLFREPILLPALILWINLVTDGPPATALAWDPSFEDVMSRPPRDPREGILSGSLLFILVTTIILTAGPLFTFFYYTNILGINDINRVRAIIFLQVVLFELSVIWNMRSESKSVFKIGFRGNNLLLAAVVLSLLMTLLIVYVPPIALAFHLNPPTLADWIAILAVGTLGFLIVPEVFCRRVNLVKAL